MVIAVNDVSVRGRPLSDVKPLLKGPAGMKLRLAVLRPGLCVRGNLHVLILVSCYLVLIGPFDICARGY